MSWTLSTSASAIHKAGTGASTTVTASTNLLAEWSDEAEAVIATAGRYDFVANYSNLLTNAKLFLQDLASAHIALNIVNYDQRGYTGSSEAETKLDYLTDKVKQDLALLKDMNQQDFLKQVT